MNKHQKRLARHALGLDNPDAGGKSYRNRYLAAHGSVSFVTWREMVREKLASEGSDTDVGTWFYLTRDGATAALDKGERLCSEDFPLMSASQ